MKPVLHGLLLAGGKSRRMGRDKAGLTVGDGESFQDRGLRLLGGVADEVFLSIASDDEREHAVPTLRDVVEDQGPLGGILSALESNRGAAWLVMACDLPNIDEEALATLVAARDEAADATCFGSEIDGRPEPLCAIYEPRASEGIRAAVESGRLCARRALGGLTVKAIALPSAGALQNCNRPEDLEELRLRGQGEVEKTLTVEFFAKLREEAGAASITHTTRAATAAGLWDELRVRHDLSLDLDTVRVAVNDEFAQWIRPLAEGDRVAFMPPFAGG